MAGFQRNSTTAGYLEAVPVLISSLHGMVREAFILVYSNLQLAVVTPWYRNTMYTCTERSWSWNRLSHLTLYTAYSITIICFSCMKTLLLTLCRSHHAIYLMSIYLSTIIYGYYILYCILYTVYISDMSCWCFWAVHKWLRFYMRWEGCVIWYIYISI